MSRAFHHPVKHAAPTNLNMRQSRMTGRFSGYLRFIAVWRYLIFSLFFFIFSLAVYSVLPSFIVTIRSYLSISPSLILCVTVSRVRFGIVSSSLSISLAVATSIALTPSSKINRFTPLSAPLQARFSGAVRRRGASRSRRSCRPDHPILMAGNGLLPIRSGHAPMLHPKNPPPDRC